MARMDDIPEPTRRHILELDCPAFESRPWVSGGPLHRRTVAIVSTAAIHRRGEAPFTAGATGFRALPAALPAADIVASHISINFDRTGFQRDLNVVYPIDRLRELASTGVIGRVAAHHYSLMGSTDPRQLEGAADRMAALLARDGVDAVVLSPV